MAHRYLEIIIPTRQFILLVAVVVGLIAGAFVLGVAVQLSEPGRARLAAEGVVAAPAAAAEIPPEPTSVPTEEPPVAVAEPTGVAVDGATAAPQMPPPTLRPEPAAEPAARVVAATPAPVVPTPLPVAPTPAHATATPVPRPTVRPTVAVPPATAGPTRAAATKGRPFVQVAAVSREDIAEDVGQRLVRLGFQPLQVQIKPGAKGLFHVRLGPFLDEESAARVVGRLRESGFRDAFLVRE